MDQEPILGKLGVKSGCTLDQCQSIYWDVFTEWEETRAPRVTCTWTLRRCDPTHTHQPELRADHIEILKYIFDSIKLLCMLICKESVGEKIPISEIGNL